MANVLIVTLDDSNFAGFGSDQLHFSSRITLQDSTGENSWSVGLIVDLSQGAQYKNANQINSELITQAQEFVQSQGHLEAVPNRYLVGALVQ